MKKFTALSLVMMTALTVVGSAAAINRDDFTVADSADWYTFRDDGSVTMAYNVADVYWANLGMTLKDPKHTQGGSYTVEVKTQLAENAAYTHDNVARKGIFASVIALNTDEDTVNAPWITGGLIIKLVDYSEDPVLGLGTDANLGTAVEIASPSGSVPLKEGFTYADLNIQNGDGLYNTVKVVVKNYKATVSVNGVTVLEDYDLSETASANGELISFGTNQNSPAITEETRLTAFRDIVIADADNKITYSTSSEYAIGDTYGAPNTGNAGTGSSNPDTADADIIMYAGMALVLLTALVSAAAARKRAAVK